MGLAVRQVTPDKHHGGAGCRGEDDQARNVAVNLIRGQPLTKQSGDKQPTEKRHRERLYRPIDEHSNPNPAPMLAHLMKRAKIDLQKHGNDHQPHQYGDRQVDLGDFESSKHLENIRDQVPQPHTHDNAQGNPQAQVSLKNTHDRLIVVGYRSLRRMRCAAGHSPGRPGIANFRMAAAAVLKQEIQQAAHGAIIGGVNQVALVAPATKQSCMLKVF